MNPLLNGAILMLVLAGGHPAQMPPVSATIPLRYLDAKNVPALVKPTPGLQSIAVNFADGTVSVRGDTQAVKAVRADILALDVQPVSYRITASVTRYQVEADGRYSESVVMSPTVMTQNKNLARVSVTTVHNAQANAGPPEHTFSGYAVQFTPTRNVDGSVTLLAEVQELGEQGEIDRSGRNERHLALGETAHVVGMTDAADRALRRRVMQGDVVRDAGAYTGYYVQARIDRMNDRGEVVNLHP